MADKATRVASLLPSLASASPESLGPGLRVASAAAPICRADLASSMVTELTALAGVMGRHYALKEGLPVDVAEAIYESVLPRSAGDDTPRTAAGVLLSSADKLDTLAGLFAVGCGPTATADPFGLRRAAYGLVQASSPAPSFARPGLRPWMPSFFG